MSPESLMKELGKKSNEDLMEQVMTQQEMQDDVIPSNDDNNSQVAEDNKD